ncbi:hypothetical protein B0H13DRAFT_1610790, partial [Mycena leptocephala]
FRFHGTRRACFIGENDGNLSPCADSDCYLCSILRCGFDVAKADDDCMFGQGIYSSEMSSKADGWTWNHHIRSNLHAMLLCCVVTGESQTLYHPSKGRTSPDSGYDSVEGATKEDGGELNYPETVVYSEESIMPYMLIMYSRQ